jgi:hypothetical protein
MLLEPDDEPLRDGASGFLPIYGVDRWGLVWTQSNRA